MKKSPDPVAGSTPEPPVPTRGLTTVAGLVVPQGLLSLVQPTAALAVLLTEIALVTVVVLAALFCPEHVSKRAFRVLRLDANDETGTSGR